MKFKRGDKVVRSSPSFNGGRLPFGSVGIVSEALGTDIFLEGHNTCLFMESTLSLVEWTPEVGEMIEVRNNLSFWYIREFRGMIDGVYITKAHTLEICSMEGRFGWLNARALPLKDTTITLANGKKVELSLESYEKLEQNAT